MKFVPLSEAEERPLQFVPLQPEPEATSPGPLMTPEEMMTPPPVEGSRFGRPQSVFNEVTAQAKQLPTDERYVLSPQFIKNVEAQLNALPSQAREVALKSMASRKDAYGRAARDIQGRYQALEQISVPEVKKRFDPRLERQVSRLVTEGDMDPQAAEFFAKRDIRMGQTPQPLPIARPDEAAELAEAERQRVSQEMADSGFIDQVGSIAASRARNTGVGLAQVYADITGDDELAYRLRGFRQIEKGREAGIPDADSIFGRSAQQAIATLAGQGPMIVVGALTGTALPVLAQAGIESFAQAYGDSRSAFKDPMEAATRASLMATAEVTFARFGLGDQFKAIRGVINKVPTKDLAGYLTASFVKEIPAEQVTTLSQFLIDKMPEVGLNPNAGMKDLFEAAAETLRQTVIQTGAMNASIYGASAAERGYSTRLLPAISQEAALARAIESDAARAGPTEAGLRARSITEQFKPLIPKEEAQPEKPEAKKPEAAPPKQPAPAGRVEPTISFGEQIPAEPGGRVEPTMGPAERTTARTEVPEEDVVPGMVTAEDIEQGTLTPVNVEEEPAPPTEPVTPVEPQKPAALPFTPAGKGPQFKGSVAPTQAAARLPETPTVAPITKTKTFEPTPDQNMDLDLPIVNLPVKDLKLSQDVPQFKYGANKKGVVKPLGGKFTTEAVAPIAVWQRNDGSLEVISGRHRLDLAQRSGTEFIPSQIYYENQGFTAVDAAIKDAELNIRDDQGAVRDYVNYFKESGMERDTAESKGFLARDKGKRGFTIANQGSDELIDALRAEQIGDEAAFYIALNAPNDSRLQAVGIKAILDGKSANFATNMMQAVKAMASENGATVDMFGFDDSGTKEAEEMAKIAQRKQREIQTRLSAITGAAKNPALAKSEGIDIKDPEAVKRRIDELRQLKTAWDNFSTNPELIAEIRAERGVAPPTFELTSESEGERRAREEKEAEAKRIEAEKEKEAERKAKADKERDEFTLTGSDREADEAAARGQEDLFAAPAEPKTGTEPKTGDIVLSTETPDGMEVRTFKTTDGYGTGYYDTDSGNFVNGSIIRYTGDDARKKAEALHKEYVEDSTPIDDEKLQPYARTPEYKKAQDEFIRAADRLNKARGTPQEPAAQAEYDKAAQELQFLKYEDDMRGEPRVRKILQKYLDQNKEFAKKFKKWLEGRQKVGDVVNGKKPAADLPAKNRLVLMPCCDTKGPTKAPAMELYKGIFFQTFAGNVQDGAEPNVVILSAKHGFISPTAEIEPYDQVMDKARADEMLANLQAQMKGGDFPKNIKDVLIVGGKEYQRVMRAAIAALQDEGIISQDATINATSGGIGEQRKQLGEYLRSIKAPERKTEFEPNESGFIGASDKEVADISKAFNAAKSAQDDESVTRVFDPPKKSEIVRAEDKTKVFVKGEGYLTVAQAKKRIEEWKRNAEQQGDTGKNSEKIVLSLFDLTGEWSKPWEEAGYQVYRFDIQADPEFGDVNKFSAEFFAELYGTFEGQDVYAILAACPCTDFASSGSKHWAAKDEDGRTVESVELVKQTLATIEFFKPSIWAIENPVGRIEKLTGLPPWRLSFNPNHFGDPYTKKTLIWGRFNADLPIAPVEPTEGSKMHTKFGGKSQKTKNARSVTPEGFAYAFFQANNAVDNPLMAVANKYDMMDPEVFKGALAAGMTEQQISEVIDDPYYFSLDYEAAEKALREAYSRPYNQAQRQEAQTHADQVGGEIAWQKGDYALIRGYSVLSGDPVYVPTMGSNRAKVDIERFTGNLIPDDVRKEMVAAKQEAERAAEEKHKRDPFVVFDNGVAISSDIPQDLAGVIREWKDLLKLDVPIFVGTIDFAKENRNKFTGPHRRIGSGTLDPNERGSMRRMSDGSYYILFKPSTSRTLMLETIAHEMGHVHERLVFNNATPEEKKALTDAHQKWVESQSGKSAKELVESLRGRSVGRATKASTTTSAAELSSYWRSFGEWYADQVSRWAMSSARPVSIVEKYFKRLAIQLRRFYQQLRARKYLPDETFEKYIEKVTSRPADIGPDTSVGEESSQMVSSAGRPYQVDTPNFKRWFGKSKVVDEQGLPMVMYHGTARGGFTVFDRLKTLGWRQASMDTVGSWFSNNPSDSDGAGAYGATGGVGGDTIYPVYLSIQNPKFYRTFREFLREMHAAAGRSMPESGAGRGSTEELRAKLKAEGYDGIEFEQTDNESLMQDIREMQDAVKRAKEEEFSVPKRDRLPYTQKRERLEKTLASMRKEMDYFGSSTEFDKQRVFVAFEPEQIKSVFNRGTFDPRRKSILYNIDPTSIGASFKSSRDEQIKEYARLRSMLGRLPKAIAEGKASIDMQRNVTDLMQRSRELQAAINKSKPRLDSAEQFLAKALTEYDKENISKDVLDVIQTAYAKQPELLEGLLLSVRTPKIAGRAAGQFDTYDRIITLFKTSSGVESPTTIRHELTHTLEQMMTPEQRKLVVQAWGNALMKAIKQNPDDAHQRYFHAILNFIEDPSPKNHKAALDLLPSYDMYQFVNPSEFWAVNAEKLMAAQLGTPWSKFKRAVRRMWEAIKKVLGFDNRSDVHKVFAQVMGGSLERTTRASLVELVSAQGADSVRLQNIDDDKNLLRTYGRPNTPMLDKTPIRTAVTRTAAEAKQVFKETVKNPVGMAKSANNALVDGILAARMKTSWYAAGLESRDFDRYGGALRDSQGIVIASVAVDNAIRSGNIGAQVIFRGGLKFDKKLGNFVAVDTKLGMKGVYMAEAALKKKLGEQLGTDIIQAYLEAKRSISIMKELFNREANAEAAKDNLKAMRDMGASPDDIAQAKEALAEAKRDLEAIEKAASSVNMTEDEMQDFAALEDKHPELRDLMNNWTAVNQNLLRVWRQVGLLSQARYDTLAAIEDYVPWYRIMRDDEDLHSPDQAAVQSTTRSLTNIGVERKFKLGQPRAVFDFRAKEGQKDFKIQPSSIVRAQVNGQPVPQNLISVKPNGEVKIDVDLKEGDLVVFETNREIQNIIDNMTRNVMRMTMNGIRQFAANRIVMEYASRNEKGKIMVFPSPDPDKGRFNWIANGRKVVVEIQDPLVAEAIYGMDNLNLKMWAPLAAAANLVRRSITLSGAFQVKQVFKDAPTAAMVTGVKNPFALIGGVWKGFLTSLIQPVGKKAGVDVEPVVEILRAAGIGGFHSPARTPEAEVKRRIGVMNGNIFSAVIQTLDHIGDSSDMAQRVAVYKRVLAETGDETQALYQAANVINFLHHGSAGFAQAAVKVVPFLGAYANSTDVLVNSLMGGGLKGMSRKRALARLAFTTSMLSLTTLLYCMLAGGDPEYDELDDQTKLRNIMIPGTKIILPMNTSPAFIFKAIPELIYNAITRQGTDNEMDARRLRRALAEVARDSLLGPEPVPAGIKPLFEVAINHNFFTGREIVPEGLKDVEAAEQYTATTSELGKKLSEYLAIPGTDKRVLNPIEADHIIRGLFGTAGAMAQWASNSIGAASETRPAPTPREQPVTGGFLREEVPRGNEDLFYDFRDAVRKKHETWKKMVDREDFDKADAYLEEHGDVAGMYQYINETEAELKEINSAIRRLGESRDKDLKPKERREEITEFQRLKQEILSPVKELRREVLK